MAPRPQPAPDDSVLYGLGRHAVKYGRRWRTKLHDLWRSGKDEGWARVIRNHHLLWLRRQSTSTVMEEVEKAAYREAANRLHAKEGVLEVDGNARVSFGEDEGA